MTISQKDLEKIARLAYLDTESSDSSRLTHEVSAIMDFVDQLRSVETKNVAPLFHPFALHQRLRTDEVTEEDCIAELEAMAPVFEDNLYLVPKVIESDK
ncbi:Asp-tRNA(Asn)/Glu-tRNA(Gln) amidotransferase subunit GatC [Legionella maioricensis]|uniref:Aspartyl/glutamyl-tRNA(Asn/Gln) amidotransferase subunit C n=1 Tax=Legionella maioricensis TaxID=2896528 RepID=A0A9X2CZL1_9GAMM|nr:Asp-tRNA(Asn)/Glu-tRNA(Gln) amidotransferase subunit GatC [Legionella maioricensis]MCL9683681.1 Asp-tRNA(Asn)/Glu-tRNA(Gln) amidotransferase subunit GatC [Legionella maioricensis]MCL9687455.1 Asp-tRNA(Asn)/Glu-tRNA(Gln) amidotransferase subunit GatC [Legionella maioricensis]